MSFANPSRLLAGRNLTGTRLQGFTVINDDSQDQVEVNREQQRIKVRIPDLDDQIKDDNDLPWYETGNLPLYSGENNIGFHGGIPAIGTKIWVRFDDDSRYHGHYLGGVQNQKTKLPDFTKWPADGRSAESTDTGSNSAGNPATPPASSSSDQTLPGWAFGSSCMTGNTGGLYEKSYPQAWGKVDPSGNFWGVDNKRDWTERTHCARGTYQIDGYGNVYYLVNGGMKTKDSPDAEKRWATGMTMIVFGDYTLYVSGKMTANVVGDLTAITKGKANIASVGDMTVQSKAKLNVVGGGDVTVSSQGILKLIGGSGIQLLSHTTSCGAITLGPCASPLKAAADFSEQKPPKEGIRPKLTKPSDPPETEPGDSSGGDTSGGGGGGSGSGGGSGGGGSSGGG